MRKFIILGLIGSVMVVGFAFALPQTKAQTVPALTESQIQAIITLLQTFGAGADVISNVNNALRGLPTTAVSTGFVNLKEVLGNPRVSCEVPRLSFGDNNNSVHLIQDALSKGGYYPEGLITGYYGKLTKAAVQRFQQAKGLNATGNVGEKTAALLTDLVKSYYSECGVVVAPEKPSVEVISPNFAAAPVVTLTVNNQTFSSENVKNTITIPHNTAEIISWTAINASACYLTASPSTLNWSGMVGTSGAKSTGNLTASQTFDVVCTNTSGSATASLAINVATPFNEAALFTVSLPPSGAILYKGSTYKFVWSGADLGVTKYSVYLVGGSFGPTGYRYLGELDTSYQGYFQWTVPYDIVSGSNYQLQFSGPYATGDNTDSFTISD